MAIDPEEYDEEKAREEAMKTAPKLNRPEDLTQEEHLEADKVQRELDEFWEMDLEPEGYKDRFLTKRGREI